MVANNKDKTVEQKLKDLVSLQQILSEIDHIKFLRGELPLEVQDLEDEIKGMETRLNNLEADCKKQTQMIGFEKTKIETAKDLINKYNEQLNNVKNNREYDNLSKEIEFQGLEIELSEKKIKEFSEELNTRKERISTLKHLIEERSTDLKIKQDELKKITNETKQDEERLKTQALSIENQIEDRLLSAFKRIRKGARNGLAVVSVDRDACGGCYNKIPPQRQLDIKLHKKIIVCEYCGRIMVDNDMKEEVAEN